ncbi:retinol dehydrogenase 7-like [Ruditapes philippinarum]|uniref:retinol dehydrogenase 7-like n=1 Tax=Ruditapes philippinarum TaxID=129788 RepID=UPI00295A9ED5|nr:retinol dehydrogenase 7-like [Ruditapes philippinarum]
MMLFDVAIGLLILYFVWKIILLYLRTLEIKQVCDRYVFITGCDTGFGYLLARSLDAKGVNVIAGCLTEKGSRNLKKEASSRIKTVQLDVTDKKSVERAFELTKQYVGDKGLWGLVNNAGIMLNFCPAEWTPLKDYETESKVNLFGTIDMSLTFLPLLRMSRGRRELLGSGVTTHTIEPGGFNTNIANESKFLKILKTAYVRSDTERQNFYGGKISSYIFFVIKWYGVFINTKPQKVVDVMAHALLAKHSKNSYAVGLDATLFFGFLSWFPEWLVDRLLGWPAPDGHLCSELQNIANKKN